MRHLLLYPVLAVFSNVMSSMQVKKVLESLMPYTFISHTKYIDRFRNGSVHKGYCLKAFQIRKSRARFREIINKWATHELVQTTKTLATNVHASEMSKISRIVVNRTSKMRQTMCNWTKTKTLATKLPCQCYSSMGSIIALVRKDRDMSEVLVTQFLVWTERNRMLCNPSKC